MRVYFEVRNKTNILSKNDSFYMEMDEEEIEQLLDIKEISYSAKAGNTRVKKHGIIKDTVFDISCEPYVIRILVDEN